MDHPHIVRAVDAGEDQGRFFLVLEYIDGEDLDAIVLRNGPLAIAEAIRVGIELGLALQHLHAHGLIHRDVKPSNLIRHRHSGMIKLLDLGLSRFDAAQNQNGQESFATTQQGVVLGTPDFIAPEQAINSQKADIRSDLYSAGCTLFFLLTGNVPFPGGTAVEKLIRQHQDATPDLQDIRTDIPPQLAAIVAKLLAKKTEARYQKPVDYVKALVEFQKSWQAASTAANRPTNSSEQVDFSRLLDDDPEITAQMLRPRENTIATRWAIPTALAIAMVAIVLAITCRYRTVTPVATAPTFTPTPATIADPRRGELLAELRRHRGTAEGVAVASRLQQLASPLDSLPGGTFGVPC